MCVCVGLVNLERQIELRGMEWGRVGEYNELGRESCGFESRSGSHALVARSLAMAVNLWPTRMAIHGQIDRES